MALLLKVVVISIFVVELQNHTQNVFLVGRHNQAKASVSKIIFFRMGFFGKAISYIISEQFVSTDQNKFWNEIKKTSSNRIPLLTNIEGIIGHREIISHWRIQYNSLFNCVDEKTHVTANHILLNLIL